MNKNDGDEKPAQEKALILHEHDDHALIIHGTEDKPQAIDMITKVKEGQPVLGDVLTLSKRSDGFYTMERTKVPPPPTMSHHGPAMVTSPAYRENYERIFASKKDLN